MEFYDDDQYYVYNPETISYDVCSFDTPGCLSGARMNEIKREVSSYVMSLWFDDD